MTTDREPQPTPPTPTAQGFEALAVHRTRIAYVLIGLGLALTAVPIVNAVLYGYDAQLIIGWGILMSLGLLAAGVLYLTLPPGGPFSEGERLRVLVLLVSGYCGTATAFLALLLPFTEPYYTALGGGLEEWRKNVGVLLCILLPLIGGLALIFLGLQLARTLERSQATLRRLLYGYNAVLSGLLLLAVLGVVNVLAFVRLWPFSVFSERFDWTGNRSFTLSQATRNTLQKIQKPLKVYAILRPEDPRAGGFPLNAKVVELLQNCAAAINDSRLFTYEVLSRDLNRGDLRKLTQKYPSQLANPYGLLLVYGVEDDAPSDFIKEDDLVRRDPRDGRVSAFVGENALLRSLNYLLEGKTRVRVYFTQGNGEPAIGDRTNPDGLGRLVTQMASTNYELLPLVYEPGWAGVPADADVVVIVRPNPTGDRLPKEFVDAIKKYLDQPGKKAGKLVAMVGLVQKGENGPIKDTLEGLLAGYGVQVRRDRILAVNSAQTARGADPTILLVEASRTSTNPVAQAFSVPEGAPGIPLVFVNARTVEALPGGDPHYRVEELLVVPLRMKAWSEDDMNVDPRARATDLAKPNFKSEAERLISKKPIPVAVAVSELPSPEERQKQPEPRPRLVVFGDANWVGNAYLPGTANFALFTSSLAWLRERGDIGANPNLPERQQRTYQVDIKPEDFNRAVFLPGLIMLLCLVGAGLGVWVVRRRWEWWIESHQPEA